MNYPPHSASDQLRLPMCRNLLAATLMGAVFLLVTVSRSGAAAAERAAFNVRDFGAVGDGKALDSPAIDRAIATCAGAGGGTVYLPAGTYLSGSIHLTNNLNLFLDAGAVILGAPQSLHAYDRAEPFEGTAYQDGAIPISITASSGARASLMFPSPARAGSTAAGS